MLLPIILLAFAAMIDAAAAQSVVAFQPPAVDALHTLCFSSSRDVLWTIDVRQEWTIMSRTDSETAPADPQNVQVAFAVLTPPAPTANGSWPEGVTFAIAMQAGGVFPLLDVNVTSATWTRNETTRADVMAFETSGYGRVEFRSVDCPHWANCASADGNSVHCWDEYETCCGPGTYDARCIGNDDNGRCCVWYASAVTCAATDSCCGSGTNGAGSAFCCGAGTTCCRTYDDLAGPSVCCASDTTCCAAATSSVCCTSDRMCDTHGAGCVPVGSKDATPPPAFVIAGSLSVLGDAFLAMSQNVTAWALLRQAIAYDLAALLSVPPFDLQVTGLQPAADRLVVYFTAAISTQLEAKALKIRMAQLAATNTSLPRTSREYAESDPGEADLRVADVEVTADPSTATPTPSSPGSAFAISLLIVVALVSLVVSTA
jgi:hypothetical protein